MGSGKCKRFNIRDLQVDGYDQCEWIAKYRNAMLGENEVMDTCSVGWLHGRRTWGVTTSPPALMGPTLGI